MSGFESNYWERTLIILKPDSLERGLVGEIISRFEKVGFRIAALREVIASEEKISEHYSHLDEMIVRQIHRYMAAGKPLIVMVLEGQNVVLKCRQMIGDTQPILAVPGTIRGDYSSTAYGAYAIKNLIHASDSVESAEREIKIWLGDDDALQSYRQHLLG